MSCQFGDGIVCPYCGHQYDEYDSLECIGLRDIDCNECAKTFRLSVDITYTTEEIPETDQASLHDLRGILKARTT